MALMLAKTYAAFKAAGVGDEEAQAAAEELAGYETRFGAIGGKLSHIDGGIIATKGEITAVKGEITAVKGELIAIKDRIAGIEVRIAGIEGKIPVLLWVVGINAAATIAILGVLLRHG